MRYFFARIFLLCVLICGWQTALYAASPTPTDYLASNAELLRPPTASGANPDQALATSTLQTALLPVEPPVSPDVRSSVVDYFESVYLPAFAVPMGWTGKTSTCDAGSTSQAYIDASFDLINFYRAMVELEPVINDVSKNAGSQEAALMMSVNNALSHSPTKSWTCYSESGATAASRSNLSLGAAGPGAISLYVKDPGKSNTPVGHRRWILYPPRSSFGIGSVGEETRAANALWVFGGQTSRPATDIVAWPPRGFVPYQLVYPRWSFSLNTEPGADYSEASVGMSENGVPIGLSIISSNLVGFGDNTIIWTASGLNFSAGQADRIIDIEISGVRNSDQNTYTYQVTVIDSAMVVVEPDIFSDDFE